MNIAATIDPRTQSGAAVKTPGGLRAFVLGADPKDSDRVLIEYEAKGMGTDSYLLNRLTLVCETLETVEFANEREPSNSNPWIFYPDWLNSDDADFWLKWSLNTENVDWHQNPLKMYGREMLRPRLEAIIGDGDYRYSGTTLKAQPWHSVGEELILLKKDIEFEMPCKTKFAIAIGNQYRDGNDHIDWHSDDSPEMGKSPAIASLSLGETRKFQLRHKITKEIHSFELTHGSLLLMHPGCQEEYQHRLCKAPKQEGMRINWTFRPLITSPVDTAPTLKVGDRVSCKGQDWEVKALGSDGFTTLNRDSGESITSTRVRHQELLKEALSPEIIEAEIVGDRASQLTQLESEIQSGLELCKQGEQQIWIAAHTIRSEKLYQDAGFKNFEDYCKDRWQWEKSNAHEVAGAGEVIQQLQKSGATDLPTSVAAIRPLRKLEPEQRLQVLESAKESGKVTADSVKQAIAQLITPPPLINQPAPISKYEYVPIEPKDCWFSPDGKEIVEATATAQNGSNMIRLLWGDNEDSCVPAAKVMWQKPATEENLTLLHNLKAIAQQKSEEIYTALCKLNTDADNSALIEITEEIETAIAEILEFHFLGDS